MLFRSPPDEMESFMSFDMKRHNCETLDDFYAAVGYGGIILSKIMPRLKDEYTKKYIQNESDHDPSSLLDLGLQQSKKPSSGIIVDGIDNCVVKLSQCCSPLPGDDIIGFITRGHGVSIHKKDCVNYISQKDSCPERWVNVRWAGKEQHSAYYRVVLDVFGYNRTGILVDVMSVLQESRIPAHEASARELKNGNVSILLTISISGTSELQGIINKIKKVDGVIDVSRSSK